MFIACGLEIATDKEEIYFELVLQLEGLNVTVDRVKLAVAAAFDGNLAWNRSVSTLVICGTSTIEPSSRRLTVQRQTSEPN